MEQLFITNLEIQKVRHLNNISIPLSESQIKHLIFTGKNGSGKTSVTDAMAGYLNNVFYDKYFGAREDLVRQSKARLNKANHGIGSEGEVLKLREELGNYKSELEKSRRGLDLTFNRDQNEIFSLKDSYGIEEEPRNEFVKYLLDLKMTEALARNNGKAEKADEITVWFQKLEELLKQIFDDSSIRLVFDEETFRFSITEQGREPFDFSGYQAVLDIVLDIIMRMENQLNRSFDFNLPGIVLIDEIETHLHLELQRNIMPLLTTIFPNIQFIVTTHSPFVLNSIKNAVIYDLEKHLLVQNGLDDVPYDGIVEGYFGADKLSNTLKEKFERYKKLVRQLTLTDDEFSEIAELELYLDEIPDYLAIGITTEYRRLKLEFRERKDLNG